MGLAYAFRQLRFWLTDYRRTWQGSLYSGILSPVLYLGAMGLGLGTLVNSRGTASLGGVNYLTYLAPGLLAASAMQIAIADSTYPVYGSVKWLKTYQAAVSSPLRPRDLFHGHLAFTALRLLGTSTIFTIIMVFFGAVRSAWVIAAVPAAVATGLAFAAPVEAYAVVAKKDASFANIFRFGMIPLFLFSGTFFPVSQLPAVIRPLAYATPLWHGVDLCRSLSLGTATVAGCAVHVGYLTAVTAAGVWTGHQTYRRRLYA